MGCPETSVRNYYSTLRKIRKKTQISSTPRLKSEITHVRFNSQKFRKGGEGGDGIAQSV
jgi:hypothetical protein